MLKSIFTKTIYEKRWMMMWWSLAIILLTFFTLSFFPTFSKNSAFEQSVQDTPEALQGFIGDAASFRTIAGYIDQQVLAQLPFLTLILAVILFTSLLAGEENEGTLQTLLVQPVKRSRVYFEKLLAGMVVVGVACLALLAGVVIGLLVVNESVNMGRLLLATGMLWLLTLVFGVFGYVLGAITGKRGLSGGLAGVLAFTSLLISTLAMGVKGLRGVDNFSPFHYFNKPSILQYGIELSDVALLGGSVVVMVIIGWVIFERRDIYQR